MKHIPYDIIELIGSYADMDTRRNMGLPPRKIPKETVARMEKLLDRRHQLQYRGYPNILCSLFLVEKDGNKLKIMYIKFDFAEGKTEICHITTRRIQFIHYKNQQVTAWVDTPDIYRGIMMHIACRDQVPCLCALSNLIGLNTCVTRFNMAVFLKAITSS